MKKNTAGRLAKKAKDEVVLTEAQEEFLENVHPSWREQLVDQVKLHNKLIDSEWTLGFNNRGFGHGDYAVITTDGNMVVLCSTKELAEYLVILHNANLS